ncbi:hypothetical protein [Vibrio mexicanus]|uniref:hypothetical protein n=1 Tax=Vibrio mexicanus TaxID=1004326 RepID=UPI00063CC3A3|nr:hypothetical protein [Vibrio mexicanus]
MNNVESTNLNITSIMDALSKVEKVNHIDLNVIKTSLLDAPVEAVKTFTSVKGEGSIDDRFKILVSEYPNLTHQVNYLLEVSALL